jgi:N utilization substance protein B
MANAGSGRRNAGGSPDRRRQARLAAVQALYQVELGELTPRSVITEFLHHRLEEEIDGVRLGRIDRTLFGELVEQVPKQRSDLQDMLAGALDEDWPIERLERVLRIILECGVYELAERPGVPINVIVNEYVELARAFFNNREPGLVNALLDRLGHILRDSPSAAPTGTGA